MKYILSEKLKQKKKNEITNTIVFVQKLLRISSDATLRLRDRKRQLAQNL